MIENSNKKKRKTELDGIRGAAALIVVIFHYIYEYHYLILTENYKSILKILIDGHMAVCVFFILSGFVITESLNNKEKSIINFILNRYFRLMVCIWLTLPFYIIIVYFGYNEWELSLRTDWVTIYPEKLTKIISVLIYGILYSNKETILFNPFLWPIKYEFTCALMILFMHKLKLFKYDYALIIISLFIPFTNYVFVLFFIGFLLSRNKYFYMILLLISSFLISENIYYIITPLLLILTFSKLHIMNNRIFQYLGKISYPMYVVHYFLMLAIMPILDNYINLWWYWIALLIVIIINLFISSIIEIAENKLLLVIKKCI